MSSIGVFKQVDYEIAELETVEKVLERAIEKEQLDDVFLNLIIVDNEYIHNLNKLYRGIDRVTDVITFALEDEDSFGLTKRSRSKFRRYLYFN